MMRCDVLPKFVSSASSILKEKARPFMWIITDDMSYYLAVRQENLDFLVLPDEEKVKSLLREGSSLPPILAPYPPPEQVASLFAIEVLPPAYGNISLQDFFATGAESVEDVLSSNQWTKIVAERLKVNIYKPSLNLSNMIGAEKLKTVVEQIKKTENNPNLRYKGVVLVGVPGTGKSYSAKCVAGELNRWLVEMGLGYLIEQPRPVYLLRQIFAYLEKINVPVLLWIDEVEKAIGDDSPEVRRMVGELLRVLNDLGTETGYQIDCIFWMTANRIEIVQERYPELLRKGRVDVVFFVNTPKLDDVPKLLEYYLKRYFSDWLERHGKQIDEALLKRCAGIMDDVWKKVVKEKMARDVDADRYFYVPAEIEQVCKEMGRIALLYPDLPFDEVVRRAARSVYPITVSMRNEISRMRGQKEAWEEL